MRQYAALRAQVCTGVMLHGYPLVKQLCAELQARARPALHTMSAVPMPCMCHAARQEACAHTQHLSHRSAVLRTLVT